MKNKAKKIEGIIRITGKGVGYFPIIERGEDYEVQPENLNGALNRDRVSVEPTGKELYGRRQARVIEIIEREKMKFVGTLEKSDMADAIGFFLIPDDKRMYRDIFVPSEETLDAREHEKVQVEITNWPDPTKSPRGKVVRRIGKAGEHDTEMRSIVYESGFDIDFPREVEDEANECKKRFEAERKSWQNNLPENRRDFRKTTTFTIDPADAKDFDDAISLMTLPDGNYEIGIHIADVSHFVETNTALDREARKRGTSIYLVDRTIPMLPEILSNDLCSLNPNEFKYTFSAVFIISKDAEIKERWFGKTLIKSDKRFSYEEAQEILDRGSGHFYSELKILDTLAKKMRRERFEKGAIDFETEEVKFELNSEGKPIRVYKKERKDTHKLIEDLMLLANREVATYMYSINGKNQKAAFVYRIHDTPDKEKIMNLATFVKALGYELNNKDGEVTAVDIAKMIRSVEGNQAEALIKTATVRSMAKAIYSIRNIGHFGLAFKYYTHFTSPIRRYPDLLVHRFLYRHLTRGQIEQDEIAKYQVLSAEVSERELEAAEAERTSIKYKQVEYMHDHVGEEFDALISGVSEWGIYVEEINTRAEGMVKLRDMTDDFYELNEKLYAVIGKNTGRKYSLGDKARVKLTNSDLERKILDFVFI